MSRRDLARDAAALAALVGVGTVATASPVNPDAELLSLCADFLKLQAEVEPITTAFFAAGVSDAELDRLARIEISLADRQDELADQVLALRARTQDAIAAKAAVAAALLRRVNREEIDYGGLSIEDAMAWSLVQNVIGRA